MIVRLPMLCENYCREKRLLISKLTLTDLKQVVSAEEANIKLHEED